MEGLGGVKEVGGRAGRAQGGGDLAGDEAALADAGEHDAPAVIDGLIDEVDGSIQRGTHRTVEAVGEGGEGGRLDAHQIGCRDGGSRGGGWGEARTSRLMLADGRGTVGARLN